MMIARIKSASSVDVRKSTLVSYCDCKRKIPVRIIGITPQEFANDNYLLTHTHERICSIIKAFEQNGKNQLTELTLEMVS